MASGKLPGQVHNIHPAVPSLPPALPASGAEQLSECSREDQTSSNQTACIRSSILGLFDNHYAGPHCRPAYGKGQAPGLAPGPAFMVRAHAVLQEVQPHPPLKHPLCRNRNEDRPRCRGEGKKLPLLSPPLDFSVTQLRRRKRPAMLPVSVLWPLRER